MMRSVGVVAVAVAVAGAVAGDADHASRQFVLIMAAADSADCYQPGKYVSCPTSPTLQQGRFCFQASNRKKGA